MAYSINKHIVVGNIGKDLEIKSVGSTHVLNFSVATSEKYKNRDGEMVENTEWHNVTAWGKPAEIIAEYGAKGQKIYVEGQSKTRKWQDKEGNDRYTTELNVRDFMLFGSGADGSTKPASKPAPQKAPADFDDDLPF